MRRTQEGYSPFKDDKAKDTENSPFEASSVLVAKANPTHDIRFNPNVSVFAIEGITSADGRVIGKMGHSERIGDNLYRNVEGNYDMQMFEAAVEYFDI